MNFVSRHYRAIQLLFCIGAAVLAPQANATVEYVLQSGLHWHETDNQTILSNHADNYNNTEYDNSSGLFKSSDYGKYRGANSYWTHDLGAGLYIPLPSDRSALQLVGKTSLSHDNTLADFKDRTHQWEAQYQWQMSSWLEGKVRHSDDLREYGYFNGFPKELFTYYDPVTQQKHAPSGSYLVNVHTVQNEFEIGLKVTPDWTIPFNIKRTAVSFLHDNDISPYDFDSRSYETGVRYESPKHSLFYAGVRTTETKFPKKGSIEFYRYNPLDLLNGNTPGGLSADCIANSNDPSCTATEPAYYTSYKDNEVFANTAWQYGPYTILRSNLSYLKREFNQGQINHLYDVQLGVDWSYLPKTAFIFQTWNRLGTINSDDNRRTLQIRGAQLYVIWKPTYKSTFTGMTSIEQEHYTYFDADNQALVSNKTIHLGLQYDYNVTPTLTFSAYAHQRRSNSKDGTLFKQVNYWAGFTYSFENMRDNNRARVRLDQLQ